MPKLRRPAPAPAESLRRGKDSAPEHPLDRSRRQLEEIARQPDASHAALTRIMVSLSVARRRPPTADN